jgi:hypothetical protein
MSKEKEKYNLEEATPEIEIGGMNYQPLVEVIRAAYEDPSVKHFEHVPYKLFIEHNSDLGMFTDSNLQQLPDEVHQKAERIYTEAYICNAVFEEDERIQTQPRSPENASDIEYVIAVLMLWSDSTHFANFGIASLWPIYLFFESLSKYI